LESKEALDYPKTILSKGFTHFSITPTGPFTFLLSLLFLIQQQFSQALRISRKHVEIVCTQSQDTRKYFVKDLSSNGTLLNELPLPKSELVELKTGDELLVIFTDKKKQGLHFGLKFKVLNESEAEYARIPSKEQILKARAEARKKVHCIEFTPSSTLFTLH
jgi:hypothetical protein